MPKPEWLREHGSLQVPKRSAASNRIRAFELIDHESGVTLPHGGRKGLVDVRDDVLHVFDSNGHANILWNDAGLLLLLG